MNDKKIRFIDSHYNTLFCIDDGDMLTIIYVDGQAFTNICRYIDEYHFRFGAMCYHICQFAEKMEEIKATYKPA